MLELYTDGSCIDNKNGKYCGWAWRLINHDGSFTEGAGRSEEGSNNVGEMMAVVEGLRALRHRLAKNPLLAQLENTVRVTSDSQYVVKGMTEWLPGWLRKEWKTSAGDPVKNKSIWEMLIFEVDKFKANGWRVEFQHVRGHRGEPNNERVDDLAGEAARSLMPNHKRNPEKLPLCS